MTIEIVTFKNLYRVITSHKDWLTPKDVKFLRDDSKGLLSFYRGGAGCLLDKSRHVIMGVRAPLVHRSQAGLYVHPIKP